MQIPYRKRISELVINWHFTEVCNYDCKYCFAKWGHPNELHRSEQEIDELLNNLADYFIHGNPTIKSELGYENVRLNFAGGEPMMLGNAFIKALQLAKQKGFKTSIITNGHYLVNDQMVLPNNSLDMIGISFDSQSLETRIKIGRHDRKGDSISTDALRNILEKLKQTQKHLKTKINTVVNSLNHKENFSNFIRELNLDKWKVSQVMPFGNNPLQVTKKQFNEFVKRHSGLGLPIFAESNLSMTESYLMIDPNGRFFQNSLNRNSYHYSEKINICGVEKALNQISFNSKVFLSRYFSQIEMVER